MIIIDSDGEEFVRETSFDLAVPIHIELFEGETKIFTYPSLEKVSKTLEEEYSDLFSADAINHVRNGCLNFRKELGYVEDKHPDNWGFNFICDNITLEEGNSAERIRRDGKYKNLTTFNIRECLANERVIFAIVKEGQIVSVAVTTEALQKNADFMEIGVETAVGYRGNGYAAEVTRAISDFLIKKGYRVLYKCHHRNVASTAVARSAGFVEVGKFYYYVLRKES